LANIKWEGVPDFDFKEVAVLESLLNVQQDACRPEYLTNTFKML